MKTAAALLAIILLILAGARSTHAIGEDTSIIVAPEYPAPREQFSAELKTFSFDLNRAAVTWRVDGAPKDRGVGLRHIVLVAPRAGEETRIEAEIVTPENVRVTVLRTIRPAGVDLLWEAETLTPPRYLGRALPTPGSIVQAVAFADIVAGGGKVPAEDIFYVWKVDGKNVPSASGFGKNAIRFRMPDSFEDTLVEVSVSTFDESVTATGAVSVPAQASQVVFYEDDPQEGVQYHRALVDGMTVPSSAFGVLATPLYFNRSDRGALSYEWFLNGVSVESALGSESAFFRILEDRSGSSEISVRVANPQNVLQTVASFFRVVF